MSLEAAFLVYATVCRLGLVAAGVATIVLGYRLFILGVAPRERAAGQLPQGAEVAEATARGGGFELSVRNAAPGTCFALFGAVILVAGLMQGFPSIQITTNGKTINIRGPSNEGDASNAERPERLFAAKMDEAKRALDDGQTARALHAYEVALGDPHISLKDAAQAINQLAWIHQREGRTGEASALVAVALTFDPDNAEYLDTSATVALKRNELADALATAQRAVALRPNVARFERTLALCLEASGQPDDSLRHMERAAGLDSRYGQDLEDLRQHLRRRE